MYNAMDTFSLKSLNLEELYFAIRTGIGQLTSGVWNTSEVDRDDMKAFILTSSRGLVEIEPWHGSSLISEAQLVHESVREYLITGGLKDLGPSSNKMVEANDHARLFKWCSTYIRLNTRFIATDGIDIRASEDTRTTYPLLGYAVDAVLFHFEIAGIAGALPLGHLLELLLQQYIHTCSIYSQELRQQLLGPDHLFISLLYLSMYEGRAQLAGILLAESALHSSRFDRRECTSGASAAGTCGLLTAKVDLNFHFHGPWSSLLELAARRCPSLLQSILDQGAVVNFDGEAPLCTAVELCGGCAFASELWGTCTSVDVPQNCLGPCYQKRYSSLRHITPRARRRC
jgi:hypothetical protein